MYSQSYSEEFFSELPLNITFIIPAYNEEERIGPVLNELMTLTKHYSLGWQIIVAIDGDDNTEMVVRDIFGDGQNTIALVNRKRSGKGNAIKRAMDFATGDCVVIMDADGSVRTIEVLRKLPLLTEYDIVNFDRYLSTGNEIPYYRRFVSRFFNLLVRGFLGIKINDTQCGYKIARRDALMDLFKRVTISNAFFEVYLMYYASKTGYRVKEVPISYIHGEGSTFRIIGLIASGTVSLLAIIIRYSPLWKFVPGKVKDLFYDKFASF